MLRAFGVCLERAETLGSHFRLVALGVCQSGLGAASDFVSAHEVFVKGLALPSGLSSCFSTSAGGICRLLPQTLHVWVLL